MIKLKILSQLHQLKIYTCKAFWGDSLFDYDYILDNYGITKYGEEIKHKRTKIFDRAFIDKDIYKKYFKKSHEIINFNCCKYAYKGIQNNGGLLLWDMGKSKYNNF